MSMSEVDCLLCAAGRDAGNAECRSCGQVFEEEQVTDPNDPSFYFAGTAPSTPASVTLRPKARRSFAFGRRKP